MVEKRSVKIRLNLRRKRLRNLKKWDVRIWHSKVSFSGQPSETRLFVLSQAWWEAAYKSLKETSWTLVLFLREYLLSYSRTPSSSIKKKAEKQQKQKTQTNQKTHSWLSRRYLPSSAMLLHVHMPQKIKSLFAQRWPVSFAPEGNLFFWISYNLSG